MNKLLHAQITAAIRAIEQGETEAAKKMLEGAIEINGSDSSDNAAIASLERKNASLDDMITRIFARRVHIEDALMKMAEGKLPLPDAAKCRELALKLGTPEVP